MLMRSSPLRLSQCVSIDPPPDLLPRWSSPQAPHAGRSALVTATGACWSFIQHWSRPQAYVGRSFSTGHCHRRMPVVHSALVTVTGACWSFRQHWSLPQAPAGRSALVTATGACWSFRQHWSPPQAYAGHSFSTGHCHRRMLVVPSALVTATGACWSFRQHWSPPQAHMLSIQHWSLPQAPAGHSTQVTATGA